MDIPTSIEIHELYRSLQGEGLATGLPCTLVRLSGCDLRCHWCDTVYAGDSRTRMSLWEIQERVQELGDDLVLVTGGEPLLQPAVHQLLRQLLDGGSRVQLETGGHRSLADVDPRVEIIMDVKCPGSGESDRNRLENLALLKPTDQVKLVIADRTDYLWARELVQQHRLIETCHVIFTPVHDQLPAAELAQWILADKLRVRLGLQQHKLIWSPDQRGV